MAANNENADRRVVPRWRSFKDSLTTDELATGILAQGPSIHGGPFLSAKEADWQNNRALPFALDLVSAAIVLGNSPVAKMAAESILESTEHSQLARQLALSILGIPDDRPLTKAPSSIPNAIRTMKTARLQQPKNCFVWVDLARLYVLLGQFESAEKALYVAHNLAPNDRFILRCISRFYLHINEPDRALLLLRNAPRTAFDPWLMAAEIAISSVLDKTPRLAKSGQALLESGCFSELHTSELASALASLEMFSGRNKKATKLFAASLKRPTDNALAQCVWASNRIPLGRIDQNLLQTPLACEAKTIDAFNRKAWEELLINAEGWSQDEAFSSRPRVLASGIASSVLGKAVLGEELARMGLSTNPGHPGLVNNVAFSLIYQGKASDALATIATVDRTQMLPADAICLMATTGLAFFRIGKPFEGKEFYQSAIDAASRHRNDVLKTLASLYFARERVLLGDGGAWADFCKAKEAALKHPKTTLPDIVTILEPEVMRAHLTQRMSH